ncbi:MAG: hybrid sensor histidine kinase/response regulator transcription factor [Aurantibacter sp.]
MLRPIVFLCCTLFLLSPCAFSQTPQIENLTQELERPEGQERYSKTNELAELYVHFDVSKALELVEENINSPEIQQFPKQLAEAHYVKGAALIIKGDYDAARLAFDRSNEISKDIQDQVLLAKNHTGYGRIFTREGQFTKAKQAFENSLELLIDGRDPTVLANAYMEYGKLEAEMDNHDKSLEYYNAGLTIYEELNDRKGISDMYYRIAVHYDDLKNEEKALEFFTKGRSIKEDIGDIRGLSSSNLSLGVLHEEKGNYGTALDYYGQSLEGYQKIGDKSSVARVYNNIGVAYLDWGKLDSALVYHKKSLELHLDLQSPIGIIRSYLNLGETYQVQEKYDRALANLHKAKSHSEPTENQWALEFIYEKLGEIFVRTNQLDNASVFLNRALRLRVEKDKYFGLNGTYLNLSELEEKKGNHRKSLEYFKRYKEVQDSILKTQNTAALADVQAKYDTEKQEKEIISLQQENEKRTLWRNIFAIGTLITLGLALLLFQFFMYRNKKNKELLLAEETQRQELEKLDKMKSRFFSNISHEFRTPLTLILGPLNKIRKNVDGSLQPTVDTIERNGKRLLKLINQLLDLSKIESGKVALKTALIDVVPLLKGWVLSFNSVAETKGIKLNFSAEKESHFLYVDQEKMEKVIINLLSNAFKYTQAEGQISVDVVEKRNKEQGYLSISVSDTGTGIPKQELEHIFDRFYQASNADADDVTGTGIGLSLIKELIELHKGSVQVKSEVGKGSTFEALFPFGKEHLLDDEIIGISQAKEIVKAQEQLHIVPEVRVANETEQDGALPIVLMIEDNQDLRNYIREILSESYRVLEAVHGEEGVAMAIDHTPDIVLSDLMMPKMDGLQVCKLLKEDMRTSHIPVILLTAKSSKEDKIEGLKSLADDYLTKPFDTEELLIRLKNLIELRKKMQAHFSTGDILMPKKIQMNSMDSIFMEKVTDQLEAEISNSLFGVVELAYAVGLSRSQLFRKIKAITDLTPNELIRAFRLHRAMDMLKQRGASVSEIAYETGFQNPSYFSKVFQEQFGMAPSTVLKQ